MGKGALDGLALAFSLVLGAVAVFFAYGVWVG